MIYCINVYYCQGIFENSQNIDETHFDKDIWAFAYKEDERATNSEKLKALEQYEDDIRTAKDIVNGELTYCEECKDYYMNQSFFIEKETAPTRICVYEDPINSGGNVYADGYADVTYRVCPKGHKHVIYRKERRK